MNKLKYPALIAAAIMAMPAHADETTDAATTDHIYVPEVLLAEDGTGTVEVWLSTSVEEYNAFMMDIYLPAGFTIEQKRGNYEFTFNTDDETVYDHASVSVQKENTDGTPFIRMIASSMTQSWIASGDRKLFTFNITGPSDLTDTATGKLTDIDFGEGNQVDTAKDHWLPDVSFAVVPFVNWTGVETITADALEAYAPIYTLQGVRVAGHPTAPGIYLRADGTKIMIKTPR